MEVSRGNRMSSFKPVTNIDDAILIFRRNRSWSIPAKNTSFDTQKFRNKEFDHRTNLEFYKLKPVGKIFNHNYDVNSINKKDNFLDEILSPSEYIFFIHASAPISHILNFLRKWSLSPSLNHIVHQCRKCVNY